MFFRGSVCGLAGVWLGVDPLGINQRKMMAFAPSRRFVPRPERCSYAEFAFLTRLIDHYYPPPHIAIVSTHHLCHRMPPNVIGHSTL